MRKNAAGNDNESKFVDEWAAGCCIGTRQAGSERGKKGDSEMEAQFLTFTSR